MSTSFNPKDRVAVIDGPHAGQAGVVIELPSLGGVRVHRDGTPDGDWDRYWPNELILDLTREGAEALAAGARPREALAEGGPLPRRTPRVTLGAFWAAQAARRSPADAPIAFVPVDPSPARASDAVTLSFGGVA